MQVIALNITKQLDDSVSKELLKKVETSKKERLLRFVHRIDMHRSLFADLLIRKTIIEKYNIKNEDIHFEIDEYGKPHCSFINDFHFNISHSGNWVVCATDDKPIGIDVEKLSVIDLNISEHFFSPKEHEDLIEKEDPYDYFFTLWTLKESYIKFTGKGLSYPLNKFSLKVNDSDIKIEINNKTLDNIFFKQYHINNNYKMATCSLNPVAVQKPSIYKVDSLVEFF